MSTEISTLAEKLPANSNIQAWTPPQRAIMQQLGLVDRKSYNGGSAPDAPAGVIESFLTQCVRTRLDPMARQIYCIERGGKWGVQISIDGFRLIADRSKGYRGQTPAQWTADGREWLDVWLGTEPPAAARVGVFREGFEGPQYAVATFAGYCPRDRNGNLAPKNQWLTNPSNQLAKCAEMLALRKAFPNELSGLYGTEEMDQASTSSAPAQKAQEASQAPAQEQPKFTDQDVQGWFDRAAAASTVDELGAIWAEAQTVGGLRAEVDGVMLGALLKNLKERFEAAPVEVVQDAEVVEDEPVSEWPVAEIPNGDES